MASKFQFITELYNETLLRVTGNHERWTGFLRAACYNYKCSFDEQILIYAQRPDATAVLELEKWNEQFGRWVNKGATGIAVFDDANGRGRLKHYFDITDTHETQRSQRPVPIWEMDNAYTGRVIETLENTFGALTEKGTLVDAVLSASHNAVADNLPDYLRDLRGCREDSLLEELDDLNVEVSYRRALESSVAYMLLTRLGVPADACLMPEDFTAVYDFNTPATVNALGIATSDIAEMGLREISWTVMQARREQFFAKDSQIEYDTAKEESETGDERSNDYGDHLQDAERISSAESADAAGAVGSSGQIRGAAQTIPDEAPQSALHQSENQLPAGGASGGDRAERQDDGGAGRSEDGAGGGRDGAAEGSRPPALDGPDEQLPALSGGNGAQRPDLQLNSDTEKAGSDELPAFLDAHLMEAIAVSKLKLLKSSHLSQRYAMEDAISKTYPREIAEQQARIAGYGADIATVTENTHPNTEGFSPMTLAGTTYAEKKEAGAALLALCQNMLTPEATQVGAHRGLTLELSFDSFSQEYKLTMIGQLRHTVTLGADVFGNLQRMDNYLETLPVKEQTCRERLGDLQTQLETAKAEVQQPFPRDEELKTKTARLEELNALLNMDKKESEIMDGEPDENVRAPSRPPPQMER